MLTTLEEDVLFLLPSYSNWRSVLLNPYKNAARPQNTIFLQDATQKIGEGEEDGSRPFIFH
jgi:hypothetical protein